MMLLTFSRGSDGPTFTTTADEIAIDGDCIEDPVEDRTIATIHRSGEHIYYHTNPLGTTWYDRLNITEISNELH